MEETFALLADFQYSSEAMIYKGRLEAEGIPVYMRDQFIVDANPMFSNAVGGIKMFVAAENLDKAKKVLSDINQFSVDDEGKSLKCPNCGEERIELVTTLKDNKSLFSFLFSALFAATLPFYNKYKYKCNSCGFEFDQMK